MLGVSLFGLIVNKKSQLDGDWIMDEKDQFFISFEQF